MKKKIITFTALIALLALSLLIALSLEGKYSWHSIVIDGRAPTVIFSFKPAAIRLKMLNHALLVLINQIIVHSVYPFNILRPLHNVANADKTRQPERSVDNSFSWPEGF